MSVVTEVEKLATEFKDEAVKVVEAVKAEAVALEQKVRQEIASEEKVIITKMENEFLKAQMEIQRLQTIVSTTQKSYPEYIKNLAEKYSLNIAEWTFDAVELLFKKNQ